MNFPGNEIENIFSQPNEYNNDISSFCSVLSYIPYFEEIKESDYIKYHEDQTFEYTPEFHSYIRALYDAKLVEEDDEMVLFLKSYNSNCAYNKWIKDMNLVLGNEELLKISNLSFLKKAVFSFVRFERVCPGSWGIDVESGNWLLLLRQFERIYCDIHKNYKSKEN